LNLSLILISKLFLSSTPSILGIRKLKEAVINSNNLGLLKARFTNKLIKTSGLWTFKPSSDFSFVSAWNLANAYSLAFISDSTFLKAASLAAVSFSAFSRAYSLAYCSAYAFSRARAFA
jgi:hypothetical protein